MENLEKYYPIFNQQQIYTKIMILNSITSYISSIFRIFIFIFIQTQRFIIFFFMKYQFSQGRINQSFNNQPRQIQANVTSYSNYPTYQRKNILNPSLYNPNKPKTSFTYQNTNNTSNNNNFRINQTNESRIRQNSVNSFRQPNVNPSLINQVNQDLKKLKFQLKKFDQTPIPNATVGNTLNSQKVLSQVYSPEVAQKSKYESPPKINTPYLNLKFGQNNGSRVQSNKFGDGANSRVQFNRLQQNKSNRIQFNRTTHNFATSRIQANKNFDMNSKLEPNQNNQINKNQSLFNSQSEVKNQNKNEINYQQITPRESSSKQDMDKMILNYEIDRLKTESNQFKQQLEKEKKNKLELIQQIQKIKNQLSEKNVILQKKQQQLRQQKYNSEKKIQQMRKNQDQRQQILMQFKKRQEAREQQDSKLTYFTILKNELESIQQQNKKWRIDFENEKSRRVQQQKKSQIQIRRLDEQLKLYKNKIPDLQNKNVQLKIQTQKRKRQYEILLEDKQKLISQMDQLKKQLRNNPIIEQKPLPKIEIKLKNEERVEYQLKIQQLNQQILFYKTYTQKIRVNQTKSQQYQKKITQLKQQIQLLKNSIHNQNKGSSKQIKFDQILKQQLLQSQKYKENLKLKDQQIYILRQKLASQKGKFQSLKNQMQMDKLKFMSEKKNLQLGFDSQKQNYINQIASLQRDINSLEQKLRMFVAQNNKKDDFMQNYLKGRAKTQDDKALIENFFKQYQLVIPKGSVSKIWNKQQQEIIKLQQQVQNMKSKLEYEKKIKQRIIYK